MDEALVAPCGMNCGVCGNYLAMKHDLKRVRIMKSYCPGCRPRGENCTFMSQHCELIGEGKVRFCYECDRFPCRRLKALDKRYRTKYNLSMIENLTYLREQGMAAFLEEETEKWRCPVCGGVICCHGGMCYNCKLRELSEKGTKRTRRTDDE